MYTNTQSFEEKKTNKVAPKQASKGNLEAANTSGWSMHILVHV